METAELNGTRIAFELSGSAGSNVLLIMGLGAKARAWDLQFTALARYHRVARFDNRGIGESAPLAGGTSIREMATDALALMDHLGWKTAHAVGVSMGGMIAQELALAARERLLSLALIATHAGGRLVLPTNEGLKRFLSVHLGSRKNRHRNLARLLFTEEHVEAVGEDTLVKRLADNFGRHPPPRKTLLAQVGAVMMHNTAARLEALADLPTLVLRPDADILVPPRESDRIAERIPGARLVPIEGAGHGLLGQEPERVNQLLLEHFQSAGAAVALAE